MAAFPSVVHGPWPVARCRMLALDSWSHWRKHNGQRTKDHGQRTLTHRRPPPILSTTSAYACWGSSGSRAERVAIPPPTPEPDLGNASVGRREVVFDGCPTARGQAVFVSVSQNRGAGSAEDAENTEGRGGSLPASPRWSLCSWCALCHRPAVFIICGARAGHGCLFESW
jgi:hypothetical protein